MVLKIIKTERNLVINLPKMEEALAKDAGVKGLSITKSTFNIVSSNDISSFNNEPRSDEDYQRIWEQYGCPTDFTIDDMKWIDMNVR